MTVQGLGAGYENRGSGERRAAVPQGKPSCPVREKQDLKTENEGAASKAGDTDGRTGRDTRVRPLGGPQWLQGHDHQPVWRAPSPQTARGGGWGPGGGGRGASHLLVCRKTAAAVRDEPGPGRRQQEPARPVHGAAPRWPAAHRHSPGSHRCAAAGPSGAERSAAPHQTRSSRRAPGYASRQHPPHAGARAGAGAAAPPPPLGDLLRPGTAPHSPARHYRAAVKRGGQTAGRDRRVMAVAGAGRLHCAAAGRPGAVKRGLQRPSEPSPGRGRYLGAVPAPPPHPPVCGPVCPCRGQSCRRLLGALGRHARLGPLVMLHGPALLQRRGARKVQRSLSGRGRSLAVHASDRSSSSSEKTGLQPSPYIVPSCSTHPKRQQALLDSPCHYHVA